MEFQIWWAYPIYLHIKLSFVMFTLDEHFFSTENLQIFTCVLFLLSIRSVSSDNSYDWWGQCHVTLYLVVFLNATIHTRTRVKISISPKISLEFVYLVHYLSFSEFLLKNHKYIFHIEFRNTLSLSPRKLFRSKFFI